MHSRKRYQQTCQQNEQIEQFQTEPMFNVSDSQPHAIKGDSYDANQPQNVHSKHCSDCTLVFHRQIQSYGFAISFDDELSNLGQGWEQCQFGGQILHSTCKALHNGVTRIFLVNCSNQDAHPSLPQTSSICSSHSFYANQGIWQCRGYHPIEASNSPDFRCSVYSVQLRSIVYSIVQ